MPIYSVFFSASTLIGSDRHEESSCGTAANQRKREEREKREAPEGIQGTYRRNKTKHPEEEPGEMRTRRRRANINHEFVTRRQPYNGTHALRNEEIKIDKNRQTTMKTKGKEKT